MGSITAVHLRLYCLVWNMLVLCYIRIINLMLINFEKLQNKSCVIMSIIQLWRKRETMCSQPCATTVCVKHKGTPTMATLTGHGLLCNLHAYDVIRLLRAQSVPGNKSVAWQ